MKHIFLVEDDKEIAKNLILLLRSEGFTVTHVSTRHEAVDALAGKRFDLALVDISLPDGNGFTVCTEIKAAQKIPVIFLTASDDEASVVTGLTIGADDYITKPFRPRELIARIGAALRKGRRSGSRFELCGLRVDTDGGVVEKDGAEIYLSALEYRLLLVFINNPKGIITRSRLLDELWDAAGGAVAVFCAAAYGTAFFLFTKARYHSIAEISSQIDRVLHNADHLYIAESEEGELSILQSEITKMTLRIREQNEELKKEKEHLADSMADIAHQLRAPPALDSDGAAQGGAEARRTGEDGDFWGLWLALGGISKYF